jgi:hypothetical protein
MSRLDRHVDAVRNKLALGRFVEGLCWTSFVLAVLFAIGILVDRFLQFRPPQWHLWLIGGGIAAVVGAVGYAVYRRPSRHEAAIAIDQTLALKEKFSTALYARHSDDPFAKAAVQDAEFTAQRVSIHKRFPLEFPRVGYGAITAGVVAMLLMMLVPAVDLFGREEAKAQAAVEQRRMEESKRIAREALVQVQSVPKDVAANEKVQQAQRELENIIRNPPKDPAQARRTAIKAMQDVQDALKQEVEKNQKYADAHQDSKMMRNMKVSPDAKGPVADAQRKLQKGDFQGAVEDIGKMVENFDKMTKEEQDQAIQQMQDMANQLAQMANDPNQKKQLEEKLQQMGATEEQAKQMADDMQKAANGDQAAQQRLAQQQQQMMQQMNNGQGPTQQQQQAMQQQFQQMQGQANAQAQAQQMADNAQQMANGMQQAQNAQQQGGQQGAQGQQQMADAQAQMQRQLEQMQAMQNDAEQVAAAQRAAEQRAQQMAQNDQGGEFDPNCPECQGGNCNVHGKGKGRQNQKGRGGDNAGWNENPQQAEGRREKADSAPGSFVQEHSPSQDDPEGRTLASHYVKADSEKGESRAELKEMARNAETQETDDVDQERVSRQAQEVVKGYFQSMQED